MNTQSFYFIIPFIFSLIAIFLPFRSRISIYSIGFATLKHRYQKWENWGVLFILIYVPLFGYLFGKLFLWFYHQFGVRESKFLYEILPPDFLWYVIGTLLSFSLIAILMRITYQFIFRIDYEEYLMFTNIKHGFDGLKIIRPILGIIGCIACVSAFLLTDYSIKVGHESIEFNDFLSLKPRSEEIKNIESIYFVKKVQYTQSSEEKPHHVIAFRSGYKWTTIQGLRDEGKEQQLIAFLSRTAGLKVDTLTYGPIHR